LARARWLPSSWWLPSLSLPSSFGGLSPCQALGWWLPSESSLLCLVVTSSGGCQALGGCQLQVAAKLLQPLGVCEPSWWLQAWQALVPSLCSAKPGCHTPLLFASPWLNLVAACPLAAKPLVHACDGTRCRDRREVLLRWLASTKSLLRNWQVWHWCRAFCHILEIRWSQEKSESKSHYSKSTHILIQLH